MKQEEHQQQSLFIEWCGWHSNVDPRFENVFAIPNGGDRNLLVAVKMKREGVKAGVPDVFVAIASDEFHGLFLEFKSAKGRVTPEQLHWHSMLRNAGYLVIVVRSALEAIKVIKNYFGLKHGSDETTSNLQRATRLGACKVRKAIKGIRKDMQIPDGFNL